MPLMISEWRDKLSLHLKSKRFRILSGIALVFILVILVFQTRPILEVAKTRIQKRIESVFVSNQIRIGKLTTNFINSVSLSSFEISNPGGFQNGIFFKTDKVKLKLSPLKILQMIRTHSTPDTEKENGVALIKIIRPSFSLARQKDQWNFPKIKKGGGFIPPIEIEWQEGKIVFADDSGNLDRLEILNFSGSLNTRLGSPSFKLTAETPQNEKLYVEAKLNSPHSFEAKLQGENIQPGSYLHRFKIIPDSYTIAGSLNSKIELSGPWPFKWEERNQWKYTGASQLQSLSCELPIGNVNRRFVSEGELKFINEKIEIQSLIVKNLSSEITVSGSLISPKKEPQIQTQISGKLCMEEWSELLPKGYAHITFNCLGKLTDPEIRGNIKVSESNLARLPFLAEAVLQHSSATTNIKLTGQWNDGKISGQAQISPKKIALTAKMDAFSIDNFFINEKNKMGGKIFLFLSGKGDFKNPKVIGKIGIRDFSWTDLKINYLSGIVNADPKTLRITLSSPDAKNNGAIEIVNKGLLFLLKECRLNLSGGEKLQITGRMEQDSKKINGIVSAKSIPASKIGSFVKVFSNFDGKLSLKGTLDGTLHEPLFKSKLTGTNLTLAESRDSLRQSEAKKAPDRRMAGGKDPKFSPLTTGQNPDSATGKLATPSNSGIEQNNGKRQPVEIGNLSSEMYWDKSLFQLSNISLGASYKGSFSYWRSPESKFFFKVTAKNGNPKILFALMNAPTDISGKLNGKISLTRKKDPNFKQNEPAWKGEGNLLLSNGQWGETLFEEMTLKYRFEKAKLRLENLSFKQKEGSMTLQASANQNQEKNPLEAKVRMKNFYLGGNLLDGDLDLGGYFSLSPSESLFGTVKSNNLVLNHFNVGKLHGTIELKEMILALKNFSFGDLFRGECEILFGKMPSPQIKAQWSSSAKEMKEWATFLRLSHLPLSGQMALSGNIDGTVSDMEFSLFSTFFNLKMSRKKTNGTPREEREGFNGTGKAILSKKILKSLSVKMATKDGSRLTLLGQANLKSQELSLETFFDKVNSALFLEMVGVKILEGKSSGQLTFKGNWNNPVIKGEIKGMRGWLGTIPLDSWEVAGTFREKELLISRLNFFGRKGSWRFSVLEDSWIRPEKEEPAGSFRLVTDFANLSLGPVFFVGSGIAEGRWKSSSKSEHPLFEGTVKINECVANNYEFNAMNLNVQFQDKKLKFLNGKNQTQLKSSESSKRQNILTGEIDFSKLPSVIFKQLAVSDSEKRIFFLDGGISPEKPSFQTEGTGVDVSLISEILQSPLTFSGKTNFKMQGTTAHNQPQIKGELSLKNGKVEQIPIDNLVSEFQWKSGIFSLLKLQAQSKIYYTVNAKGSLPLKWGTIVPAHPKIDFTAKLSDGNLALLNLLESDWVRNAKGSLGIGFTLRGIPSNPELGGLIEIAHGELDSRYLAKKAKELNVRIKIDSNKIVFEKSECKIGDGNLKMSGQANCSLEGNEVAFDNFNLSIQTLGRNGIPIQVPELPLGQDKLGLISTPSKGSPLFSIQMVGKRAKPKMSGWVELANTLFSYPPTKKIKSENPLLDKIEWDLKLKTGKQTIFQNDFAYAQINGEMNFKGRKEDLLVNGKINSDEGAITIYGAKFNLIEATLEVLQPPTLAIIKETTTETEPKNVAYLQLKAERNIDVTSPTGGQKIPDTITVQLERTPLTQSFDSQKLTFRSSQNPNLSSEKAATMSGIGVDLEGLNPEERDIQLRQGIARLLDAQLASPLARTILQRTGLVHKIEISQESTTGRTEELRGTERSSMDAWIGQSILLERTFGGKVGIGYKATFDKIRDQADFVHQVQLRYPFYKGFLLYGSTELDSKENLGREPERKGGVQWGIKF